MTNLGIDCQSGLLSRVFYIPSPNFNDRPDENDINLIVIHGISLPRGQYGGDAITQLFTNNLNAKDHESFASLADLKVSSHLLIRRNGLLYQYVPFNKRAWHAGVSAFQGRENCNDYSIGIELEGCDDEEYTKDQYDQLVEVTKVLLENYPRITIDRIVGHSDVAPGRKTDPGVAFNWKYYKGLLSN